MIVWILFVALGLSLGIGALGIGIAATRITKDPPAPVFQLDEAYNWLIERLPDEVAATLTPQEARQILLWTVKCMQQKGAAMNGTRFHPDHVAIASDAEIVDYILNQAQHNDMVLIPEQIYPVVQIQFDYLRALGAISTPATRP